MSADLLAQPLRLPCGHELPNRIGKSAMSEALGTVDNRATRKLETLYGRWSDGGLGLCITGNVMVDRRALGEPHNVALEDERDLDAFRACPQTDRQFSDTTVDSTQDNHILI